MAQIFGCSAVAVDASKLNAEDQEDSGDETTPTTTVSECPSLVSDDDLDAMVRDAEQDEIESGSATEAEDEALVPQLSPGLFPSADDDGETFEEPATRPCEADGMPALAPIGAPTPQVASQPQHNTKDVADEDSAAPDASAGFTMQETLFVFDWDDTILPSSWIQRQGLRLDSGSVLQDWQKDKFAEVANAAAETLHLAKQHGTVVLLTNAERGWIELSCQKFLPTLLPTIENIKIVSARTSYETPHCKSPLDWKVLAFEAEIARACGVETLVDPSKRKNIHSIGDSAHEREALLRATASLPNCCPKSLKFIERPDISKILKQHALVSSFFEKVVHHEGNLDLCISCP